MKEQKVNSSNDKLIKTYFELVKELRIGIDGAVDKLVKLWNDDGVFEFAGTPPLNGTFKGKTAINVMYKNRFNSSNMNFTINAKEKIKKEYSDIAELGPVETEIINTKGINDSRSVVGWTTKIATKDGRGFNIAGSHQFTIENNKISYLKIVVSPKPEKNESFDLESLSISDVGRLSLAAWAVV